MRRDVFVYLSGPISKQSPDLLPEGFVAAALPVFFDLVNAGIPAFCPQLTGMFPSAYREVEYETWMAYDFAVIDRCTHVLMLDGWERSKGAERERRYAIERGLMVCYSLPQLIQTLPIEGRA